MSTRPSRFSQAQILIAALFALVLSGEIPAESPIPLLAQVTPLQDEFADIFSNKGHCRTRLLRLIGSAPSTHQLRKTCTDLCATPVMPSAVAALAREMMDTQGLRATNKIGQEDCLPFGIAPKIMREYGVGINFVTKCWKCPEGLDLAWHKCRAELLKIRTERQAVQP